MIGHDNKIVQRNFFSYDLSSFPFILYQSTEIIQDHMTIDNFTKSILVLECADRHKIPAGLGVVVALQAQGVTISVFCHYSIIWKEMEKEFIGSFRFFAAEALEEQGEVLIDVAVAHLAHVELEPVKE